MKKSSIFIVYKDKEPIDWFTTLNEAKYFKKKLERIFKTKLKVKQRIIEGVYFE